MAAFLNDAPLLSARIQVSQADRRTAFWSNDLWARSGLFWSICYNSIVSIMTNRLLISGRVGHYGRVHSMRGVRNTAHFILERGRSMRDNRALLRQYSKSLSLKFYIRRHRPSMLTRLSLDYKARGPVSNHPSTALVHLPPFPFSQNSTHGRLHVSPQRGDCCPSEEKTPVHCMYLRSTWTVAFILIGLNSDT